MVSLKVCMLDPLFFPYFGGTEKVVLEVGSRLVSNHGYQVQVLTSMIPQARGVKRETVQGVEVIRSPSLYLEHLPGFLPPPYTLIPRLNADLKRECRGAEICHVHNRFWYSPRTYFTVKRSLRSHLMLTIHNARPRNISKSVDYWGGVFDQVMGRMVFKSCDRINCVSKAAMESTIPPEHRHKCTVVYNGVDTKRFRPGLDTSEVREKLRIGPGPVVLSNGRLIEQKGFPVLLKAMSMVRKEVKDAQLVVIGKGPLKSMLMREAAELGMRDEVHFVTGIPEEEIPKYYCLANVFALASLYEPSAVVLYEALGSGKAIVATSVGGNPEIVSEDCGFIVPPRDPHRLAEKLLLVLKDQQLRGRLEEASRERALSHFDWDVITKEWVRSYEALG